MFWSTGTVDHPFQDCLVHMHLIFRLIKGHALGPLQHLFGDLFLAMGRQTVRTMASAAACESRAVFN
jgi:hypothetical protein